jgi:HupE / UreJ protein
MMNRSPLRLLAVALFLTLAAAPAMAHQFAPALLEIEERSADEAAVRWKQPAVRVQGSQLRPVLPVECEGVGDPEVKQEGTGVRASWRMRCPGGLTGKSVGVEGIAGSQADVLLRITLRDGRRIRHVLKAETPSFRIDADSSRAGVFKDYAALGVEHILLGWDHLLFVLALVLGGGGIGSLFAVVTAFTVAHSITLALAVLGAVSPPAWIVEPVIALSIVYVAAENVFLKRTASWRWAVGFAFGLVHGFGFAGALLELDLPPAALAGALLSFNLGVEAGQAAVIAAFLPALLWLRGVAWERRAVTALSAVVLVAGLAFLVERVLVAANW